MNTRSMFGTPAVRSIDDEFDRAPFETPWRGEAGRARAVYVPGNVEEVRAVVADARSTGAMLVPQGANTGLVGASVPDRSGTMSVLSLSRLRSILDISEMDGTATVEAGVTLSQLNAAALPYGLHLAVDLTADPTIAGMIATNAGGNRVVRDGPMRDHVLGAEAVVADDDISVIGDLVALRKDSRGFDATRLLVGSGGAMGVVTKAVVRLSPLPIEHATWWLAIDSADAIPIALASLLRRAPRQLSAFEFVSTNALMVAADTNGAPAAPFARADLGCGAILVEWSFDPGDDTSGMEEHIAELATEGLVCDGVLMDTDKAWDLRHRISEGMAHLGVAIGHDVAVPRHAFPRFRSDAVELIAALEPTALVCDFGHAGDGGLHLNMVFTDPATAPGTDRRSALRSALNQLVGRYGGTFSAEHGLGPLNADEWLATTSPVVQRMVGSVKQVVDPLTVLGHPRHPYNVLARVHPAAVR